MKGDTTPYYQNTTGLVGAYTINAGLAALARQLIIRKAAADSAHIITMLGIQEES